MSVSQAQSAIPQSFEIRDQRPVKVLVCPMLRRRISEDPAGASRATSRAGRAVNAKGKTACGRAVHLKIVHVRPDEEFFDNRLEIAIGNVFLGEQSPASRIGFQRARAAAKLFGKTGVFGVAVAGA